MSTGPSRARLIGGWVALNLLWVPITFQDTALLTIAIPAMTVRLAPENHVFVLAALASVAALATMIVPPMSGWLSDRRRRRGGSRRSFVMIGILIDVAALVGLSYANNLPIFAFLVVMATLGSNVALSAYQVILPESVPRQYWGIVSGIRGVATLAGSIVGFAIAGLAPSPQLTFFAAGTAMALGGTSLLAVREGAYADEQEHDRTRDWHDFAIVFAARMLVFFGFTLLQTFVLFYFRDVLRATNPSAGTALYAFATIGGAVLSSVVLGLLSDRAPRKIVTALAGGSMTAATIGFAIAPEVRWMLPFAVLFGVGFGGVVSSGWAMAMDAIPNLRDVGRDFGLWGIATSVPNVIAPVAGGWLIGIFHGTRAGYQALFGLSGFSFALASLAVLRTGRRPISSMWAVPLRATAVIANYLWDHTAYRVRHWGKVPRRRGPTLIVANHQHDFESMAIVATTTAESGPWRHPIFTASSRRMYEPGFLATRIHWLRFWLRRVNAGQLFVSLGMLPLENELGSRAIAAFAWTAQRHHGVLALSDIFDDRVAARFPAGTTSADLWRNELFATAHEVVRVTTVREPYRREILDETRRFLEGDLARMEDTLRRGATFYLTPEGHYTTDGRMMPMRGVIERLAPLATIYLAGVSYDPFVSTRFSMLYRIERLPEGPEPWMTRLRRTLAAIRPVTASQLLGQWLDGRNDSFTLEEAITQIETMLTSLPPQLFVDPELQADPRRMVSAAFPLMTKWQILEGQAARYRVGAKRRHPQFPFVDDIIAYHARFFEETLQNAEYAPGSNERVRIRRDEIAPTADRRL
ncbi:MAG: MFS transporter [Candidatus Eremiobacteraeota bacterium]|nr:MFS transporter [Candidatus Eremiobacteraeota bacterium]